MNFSIKKLILIVMTFVSLNGSAKVTQDFAKVTDSHFVVNGKPYYFIGTNFWYGAILGSKGQGGDRVRLLRELDFLKENGMTNLRVLIGSDGDNGVPSKVEPTLQIKPGVYNDTIFDGLDFLMSELGKRDMKAVLFFTNSWEWSGGYSQYLNWAGRGKNPIPSVDGWPAYMEYVKQYAGCSECRQMLKNHINHIINRTNRYTKKKYTEDPAIFSWQIGNEPRAFSAANKPLFVAWLKDISSYIKSLDKNHMVSIGSEGYKGCEEDMQLFEQIHSDKNVDYLTMHIWPKNWGWLDVNNMNGTIQKCIDSTAEYMKNHIAVARKLGKPIILEEFGFPRDHHQYNLKDPTILRDAYYASIFEKILKSSENNGVLAGCNFWAWGGMARPNPKHIYWVKGDDYMGDPAQEEQGLNSVFDSDATIGLIRKFVLKMKNIPTLVDMNATPRTQALFQNMIKNLGKGIMLGHQDDTAYGHGWYGKTGGSDVKAVTGEYPAMSGWELGHLEIGAAYNLDSVYFTDMKRLMREVYERGGINTISWHGDNIVTGKTAWDCAQNTVVSSILPGGSNHEKFLTWLDRLALFFNDLKDSKGETFPVIFRLFHEQTGSWFWWGAKQCTPDEYKRLYRMTVSYLRDVKGVHNVLYAFSPAGITTEDEFLSRYPGDDWVDVVGFDNYCSMDNTAVSNDKFKKDVAKGLAVVIAYAKKSNKIPILAETGMESIGDPTFFTQVLLPAIEPFNISYVLLWRNAYTLKNHFFVPFPGNPAAVDFKKFTESKKIIMSKNMPQMYVLSKSANN